MNTPIEILNDEDQTILTFVDSETGTATELIEIWSETDAETWVSCRPATEEELAAVARL